MKILNFGSLNLDYVYFVQHFVRPGETISSTGRQIFCGGKWLNQSVALAKAGAEVFHAGKIGNGGEKLLASLRKAGADIRYVLENSEAEYIWFYNNERIQLKSKLTPLEKRRQSAQFIDILR